MALQLEKGLIPPHPLANFEIKEYYENESRFNGVYSRDNLPKTIKNGAYVINLDEYADVGTQWIALYVKNDEVIYFDSFGVEQFSVDNMKKTGLNGYVYDFSVVYDAIAVDDILDIHKYLMEKNGIV